MALVKPVIARKELTKQSIIFQVSLKRMMGEYIE